jgi:dipeptidyl aminopeptidase/acylaminoacyl peptidase
MKAYGYKNTEEAIQYDFKNRLNVLKEANIPVIIVAGEKDDTVPFIENGEILKDFYESNGLNIETILLRRRKHHPHSLKNPKKIVDFIVSN